jgi:hypothetical protein
MRHPLEIVHCTEQPCSRYLLGKPLAALISRNGETLWSQTTSGPNRHRT